MEVFEKSQTVDPEVRAYIYSLVNAVGGSSGLDDRYAVGDDALAVLNDLLRWLRLYDEKTNRFDVKRCLAEANLVKGDLLEILALWPEEQQETKSKAKLALACLQLLVPLTWPIELDEDKTTVNHLRHTPYLQLAQVGYKRAVLQYEDARILRTAVRVGLPSMAEERMHRSKRDEGIIKMVLYFFRNIAMISQPQHLPSQGDENDVSRSATIEAFHLQDVFSLILTVASGANDEFRNQDVMILETLFHLVKGIDPKKLFLEHSQLAKEETTELQNLMQKEKAMLSGYQKHAPTRHNRFGTMLWLKRDDDKMSTITGQNTITNDSTMLIQLDKSKKWDRPKHRGKWKGNDSNETESVESSIDLTENARQRLRRFTEDFLDSGFNPLFSSLRKAIEQEADRLGQVNHRQYFYLISWFLAAEAARREQARIERSKHPRIDNAVDNTYAYIAAVLDQETFVLLNRHMQRSFDEKSWKDLRSSIMCFTRILLTVQSMSESEDEEDQEIAENIQNRIFYEESTHDRVIQILRGYSNQGFAYLDAVTECVHVFVRMLEKYSKQNVDLQIRSKRRARQKRKKKQQQPEDQGNGETAGGAQHDENDAEEEAEDANEAQYTARERKFDFARFSSKFTTQPCANTFVSLLHYHTDLNVEQLKRCHRYFYRLAFKNEMVTLLFRVDILALLHKLIKGPDGLSPEMEGFKEWEQLIQQIFRRCIKWVERDSEGEGWKEAAVVEMLFSKISGTSFYLQNGFEMVVEKRAPRPPAELVIKGTVAEGDRMGVVVSVMLELGKGEELDWTKRELLRAIQEREAWELDGDEREMAEERRGIVNFRTAPIIMITPDNEERKLALFKDKYLRLLLTTAGLERLGSAEDFDASWSIPSELYSVKLKEVLATIRKAEFDPPAFEEGTKAQDLIRTKSATKAAADPTGSESGSDREIEDSMFPANLPEKRKHHGDEERPSKKRRLNRRNGVELTEEQAQARAEERKRKERERNSKIKSQLFVTASDDESDQEGDEEFFKLEEERRRKMKSFISETLRKEKEAGKGKQKQKPKRGDATPNVDAYLERELELQQSEASDSDSGLGIDDLDPHRRKERASLARMGIFSDMSSEDDEMDLDHTDRDLGAPAEDAEEEETPSTSPVALDKEPSALPLSEVSANAAGLGTSTIGKDVDTSIALDEDDDDEPIVQPAARRRQRAGFIIESDSE